MNSSQTDEKDFVISMHQPWASLLVHGIKRIEGRNWPTAYRGRIWIQATSQKPMPDNIEMLTTLYRLIFEMEGNPNIKFPDTYPTKCLVGSVEIVDCVEGNIIRRSKNIPDNLKLEVGYNYCYLCENPRRLIRPVTVRGWPKIWKLPPGISIGTTVPARPFEYIFSWRNFGSIATNDNSSYKNFSDELETEK